MVNNAGISKYPELRRIKVGGGLVLNNNNTGLSPHKNTKQNLSPRLYTNHSGPNLADFTANISSASLSQPLYARGKSKIGSGVIRPF